MSDRNVKIVLNCIVKNNADVIERMLESVHKHIDYWVIQDNGSTDNTPEIIEKFFNSKGIHGFVYTEQWKYVGHNRNHALQTCLNAPHGCEYVLRVDPTETLSIDDSFDWNVISTKDAWNVIARSGDIDYYRMWLYRTDLPWYFANEKNHEYLKIKNDVPYSCGNLPVTFKHILSNRQKVHESPHKLFIDAIELEQQVAINNAFADTYFSFNIGKLYSEALGAEDNLKYKLDYSKELVRRAEFFFTQYIKTIIPDYPSVNLAEVQNKNEYVYYSLYLLGNMYQSVKNYDKAVENWSKACRFDHERNEAMLRLCDHYLKSKDNLSGYFTAVCAIRNNNPLPNKRTLWIESDTYVDTGWKALDMYAMACYGMGYINEAKEAYEILLSSKYSDILPLEEAHRIRTELERINQS